MRQIFWGMLFLFLDFNLTVKSSLIGLIPDFVGCIFLIRGLDLLRGESIRFVQARPWALAAAVYTGFTWLLDLLGLNLTGIFSLLLGLAGQRLLPGRADAAAGMAGSHHRGGAQLSAGLCSGAQLAVCSGRAGLCHLVFDGAVPQLEAL